MCIRDSLTATMLFFRCESSLNPLAYDDGYVGVDIDGNRVWNRSRGISQIGDGWGHLATDAEAFYWLFSVMYTTAHKDRISNVHPAISGSPEPHHPECGF